jgi:hypothetical protein
LILATLEELIKDEEYLDLAITREKVERDPQTGLPNISYDSILEHPDTPVEDWGIVGDILGITKLSAKNNLAYGNHTWVLNERRTTTGLLEQYAYLRAKTATGTAEKRKLRLKEALRRLSLYEKSLPSHPESSDVLHAEKGKTLRELLEEKVGEYEVSKSSYALPIERKSNTKAVIKALGVPPSTVYRIRNIFPEHFKEERLEFRDLVDITKEYVEKLGRPLKPELKIGILTGFLKNITAYHDEVIKSGAFEDEKGNVSAQSLKYSPGYVFSYSPRDSSEFTKQLDDIEEGAFIYHDSYGKVGTFKGRVTEENVEKVIIDIPGEGVLKFVVNRKSLYPDWEDEKPVPESILLPDGTLFSSNQNYGFYGEHSAAYRALVEQKLPGDNLALRIVAEASKEGIISRNRALQELPKEFDKKPSVLEATLNRLVRMNVMSETSEGYKLNPHVLTPA